MLKTERQETTMKPVELKTKVAEVLAEKFLKELKRLTPVEHEFINAIRPAVLNLFTKLPEEKQALLIYFLRHRLSEPSHGSLLDIKRLISESDISIEGVNLESFEKVKKQVQYIHGVVASTVLVAYGGLGEEHIAVEG